MLSFGSQESELQVLRIYEAPGRLDVKIGRSQSFVSRGSGLQTLKGHQIHLAGWAEGTWANPRCFSGSWNQGQLLGDHQAHLAGWAEGTWEVQGSGFRMLGVTF